MPEIRGLTVRQPYAGAILTRKRIENRTWNTHYRGLIAVHAAAGVGTKREFGSAVANVADLMSYSEATVLVGSEVRGAVVAVARLADVCSAAHGDKPVPCSCGPWAVQGQRHFLLADVRPLAEPVPVKGALGLWHLPDELYAALHAQLGAEVASHA